MTRPKPIAIKTIAGGYIGKPVFIPWSGYPTKITGLYLARPFNNGIPTKQGWDVLHESGYLIGSFRSEKSAKAFIDYLNLYNLNWSIPHDDIRNNMTVYKEAVTKALEKVGYGTRFY